MSDKFNKIYPITHFQHVIDEDTNENLYQYLAKFNHINLGYVDNSIEARRSVKSEWRKKGLYISYYIQNNPITEVFIGNKTEIDNNNWILDTNWQPANLDNLINTIPVADEEDIHAKTIDGIKTLQLADKEYSPSRYSGLGIKILRKNIVKINKDNNEHFINILTQDDFNKTNTIYVIKYDFNLNGETIVMPIGSTLLLYGGVITNGIIRGVNSELQGFGSLNCTIKGTWKHYGVSTNRPKNVTVGTKYFDTSLNIPIWFNGSYWVNANGDLV